MHPLMVGAFVNSALYLAAVFLAGLAFGLHIVVVLAILSMALAFLCYADQVRQLTLREPAPRWRISLTMGLHLGSNLAGIAAGLLLLLMVVRSLRF
jgi:hypothetical protein